VKYAESFGAKGYLIQRTEDLLPTLQRALADGTVSIIACPVDYLGRSSKQAGDEGDLVLDVSLPHAVYLSLPDHIHDLVALQRSPCSLEGKEAHCWLDQPLDKTVVCSTRLFKYLTCRSSTDSGSIPAALSAAMALG
jgi:hypothetical protein